MFAQFEEGNLLSESQNVWSETRDDAEIGNESDDDLTIPPPLRKEEMDAMSSGDDSDDEPMYTEMLEDIHDVSQSHTGVNRREEHYKICDWIKQIQSEWKGALLSTQNMGKGLHKLFKLVVN